LVFTSIIRILHYMQTIAIIWWWAAGMMAAATLLERDDFSGTILLFEKNKRLWAKVIISGGGRCNVTTWVVKRNELKTYYTRGAEFLDRAFREFWPRQVRAWFEDHWVSLKQEEDGRIFPVSDDGKDIVEVFENIFHQDDRMSIQFWESVESVSKNNDTYCITTSKREYVTNAVVLTTGGNAYAHTWSSGDGYAFARACWHTITPLWPSLNSFMTREKRLQDLSGLSFINAWLWVSLSSGEFKRTEGPMLLTHFWCSGPAVFVIASYTAFEDVSWDKPMHIYFQPRADMNYDQRNESLLSDAQTSPKKSIQNILSSYFPKRFVQSLLGELHIQSQQQVSTLTKQQRTHIAKLLWDWIQLTCIKRRPGDEFVTAWGVSLNEIDNKTMQSTICPWLYFAGEIMDVDWVTWWYNLQASWAAGRLVGKSI